jgi:hypothetical protein
VGRSGHPAGYARPRPLAPDDDPDFLSNLDAESRRKDEELFKRWEEDLRKREEDLKKRGPDPNEPGHENHESGQDKPPTDGHPA